MPTVTQQIKNNEGEWVWVDLEVSEETLLLDQAIEQEAIEKEQNQEALKTGLTLEQISHMKGFTAFQVVAEFERDSLTHYSTHRFTHDLGLTQELVESNTYGLLIEGKEASSTSLGGIRQITDAGNLYWGCFMRWNANNATSPYYIHWSENEVSMRYRNRLNRSIKDATIKVIKFNK